MNTAQIYNRQDLIDYLDRGNKVKYLYFWGHRKNLDNSVGQSCFSQWYEASFLLDDIEYQTAEHYMMAEKARLFGDRQTLEKILAANSPGEAKKLGRLVQNFQEETWLKSRQEIVIRGNLGKFKQNEQLGKFLINTGDRILVEASPIDRIWGIGMDRNDFDVANPHKWKGLNLLGFALMEVRNTLRQENYLSL
ncbi:MAG: NADAR family protein [Cyanobacteria bacterium J06600_6]